MLRKIAADCLAKGRIVSMQDIGHPMRKAFQSADIERLIIATPPVKDPEMQAWLSPLSVREDDTRPVRKAVPQRNLVQGFTMSALAALSIGALTWTVLPRDSGDDAMMVADNASIEEGMMPAAGEVSLEESMMPAAGGAAVDPATEITDEAGIKEIEEMLQKTAFQPGTVDGMLDDRTEIAIREYEAATGRTPTGVATVGLRDELRQEVANLNP